MPKGREKKPDFKPNEGMRGASYTAPVKLCAIAVFPSCKYLAEVGHPHWGAHTRLRVHESKFCSCGKVGRIARQRLANQRIAGERFNGPAEVVAWMGMIQAQDYLAALWAIGLRMTGATEAMIEKAIADRTIIRTWPARGTLHFVAAPDVRWMLDLLAPRAIARSAGRFRQLGIDEQMLARSRKSITRALRGGATLSRPAIFQLLESEKVSTAGQRGIHILWRLAHEGLICYGAREGKQHTFALLDEWVPRAETLPRDQAMAELATRYFTGHGPATLKDFAWWSGLTDADAREGIESAGPAIIHEVIEGCEHWIARSAQTRKTSPSTAYLLPAFDEYLVGYKDRSAVLNDRFARRANAGGGILNPTIVIRGNVVGTWKRTFKRGAVIVTPEWFTRPERAQERVLARAVQRYGEFLELPSSLYPIQNPFR